MSPSKIPLFSVVEIIHLAIDPSEAFDEPTTKSAILLNRRKLCASLAYGESRSLIISLVTIHIDNDPMSSFDYGTFTSAVNDELFRRQREGTLWEIAKLNTIPLFWRENIGNVHRLSISRAGNTVKRYEDLGLDLRGVHTLHFLYCAQLSDLSGLRGGGSGSSIHKLTIYYCNSLKNLKGLEGIHTVTLSGSCSSLRLSYDLTGLGKNHTVSFFHCDLVRNTEAVSCAHSLELEWVYDHLEDSKLSLDFSNFKEARNITLRKNEELMMCENPWGSAPEGIEKLQHLQYVRILPNIGKPLIIPAADILEYLEEARLAKAQHVG